MKYQKGMFVTLFIFMTVLFALPAQAAIDEDRIARLEAQLAAMQAELAELKSLQSQSAAAAATPEPTPAPALAAASQADIEAAVARAMEQQQIPAIPEWVENIKLQGDFRYRYEWEDNEARNDDRNRNRIQTRIGIYGKVNPEIDFGFRIASGNNAAPMGAEGAPTSNNQDLSHAFSSKNIWLDLAYINYHPAGIEGLNIYGGKMNNPLYRVGNSDLMFDTDVTPEGIAAVYKTPAAGGLEWFASAGGFYVEERSTEADTSLWALQGAVTHRFGQERSSHLTLGAGYFDYANIRGESGLGLNPAEFYGNRNTGGVYDSDFNIAQGFGEIGMPLYDLPFRVFADVMKNTQAASSEDTAFLVGAGIGKCTAPGTWALAYNYRDIEADAIVGVLADATFSGGGSNVKGHKLSYTYQVAKNWQLGLAYMDGERTRTETTDYDTFQLDMMFKF